MGGRGNLRRCALLTALLALLLRPATAQAAQPQFRFTLLADGAGEAVVQPGDVITLTLRLERTDSDERYAMYAMQDEVVYDPAFLRPVQEGALTADGVRTADVPAADGLRACVFSFVSFDGGAEWPADVTVAMVQFRVVGESGASALVNRHFLVSCQNGRETYEAAAVDAAVAVSEQCTVRFESNGGTPLLSRVVSRGETIARPGDPLREGYRLTGWYTDAALTDPWDFDSDRVTVNMTLYAGWEAEPMPRKGVSPWWALLLMPAAAGALWMGRARKKQ